VSLCGLAKGHLKSSCETKAQEKSRGAVLDNMIKQNTGVKYSRW